MVAAGANETRPRRRRRGGRGRRSASALPPPLSAALREGEVVTPPRVELAPRQTDPRHFGDQFFGLVSDPNPHIERAARDKAYQYAYGPEEELLDKDLHLLGVIEQRLNAVLGAPRRIVPAEDAPLAAEIAAHVEACLAEIPSFEGALRALLLAWWYGFSAVEPLWPALPRPVEYVRPAPDGGREGSKLQRPSLFPRELVERPRYRIRFGIDNCPRVLTVEQPVEGVEAPPGSLIIHTPDQRYGNPYGTGRARAAWWWLKFKHDGIKWFLVFVEKFASPTAVVTYPKAASAAEQKTYKKIASGIAAASGITVPEGVLVSLLEAMGSRGSDAYARLCEYCDRQVAIGLLGQTLTVQQGETGARAMAEVHLDVRASIVRSDARALEATLNTTLLRWLTELNWGEQGRGLYPRLLIDTDPPADATAAVERFTGLRALGLELSKAQIREECNAKAPVDEEDTLGPPEPAPLPPQLLGPDGAPAAPQAPQPGDREAEAPGPQARFARPLHAAAEPLPGEALSRLYREGVKAAAALTAEIPALLAEHFRQAFTERYSLGADPATEILDTRMLGWAAEWALPAKTRAELETLLNDSLSLAALEGRAEIISAAPAQAARTAPEALRAAEDDPSAPRENPLIEALFGKQRLIPRAVLSVFTRKVHSALEWEGFYQLDALARAASFTAWDLCEADVRHIGGALQDAIHNGWSCQQFADYLYERLEARYLVQGSELHAWHVETIYHTNLATSYNTAQMDQIYEYRDSFPYIEFLNPDPQFETCRAMAGKVWRTDDPVWRSYIPPLHFNCGSDVRALTVGQFAAGGYALQSAPPALEDGTPALPEIYSGPADPLTGKRTGKAAPFGAWAPQDERYAHLEAQRSAL